MELDGNEKRIQALFSELSFENQHRAPRFEHLWTRAQATRSAPEHVFSRSLAVIVAVLIIAAVGVFAAWSGYESGQSQEALKAVPQVIATPAVPRNQEPAKLVAISKPPTLRAQRRKRPARHRQSEGTVTTEAALLSNWQSPTRGFMESPTGLVINSLPQLNQSVKDLKSFLAKHNEVMKESNQ